jgi:Leucine-rich repeat (LRR) protein
MNATYPCTETQRRPTAADRLPAWILLSLVAVEGLLFTSERFGMTALGRMQGVAVMTSAAVVSLAFVGILVWYVVGAFLGIPLRFRLWQLALAFVVIAIQCGWLTMRVRAAAAESAAAIALKASQGGVRFENQLSPRGYWDFSIIDPAGPSWLRKLLGECFFTHAIYVQVRDDANDIEGLPYIREMSFSGNKVTNATLNKMAAVPHLKKLGIHGTSITDSGLAALRYVPTLEELSFDEQGNVSGLDNLKSTPELKRLVITDTTIGDSGLKAISSLTKLQELLITDDATITNVGLKYLTNLHDLKVLGLSGEVTGEGVNWAAEFPKLSSLGLDGAEISDDGLGGLEKSTSLRDLGLRETSVTDKGLAHLRDLSQLESLALSKAHITDAGLSYLSDLRGLKALIILDANITDAGLVHLTNLPNLNTLALDHTQITDAGVETLMKLKLPHPATAGIVMRGTQVTPAAAKKLSHALHCAVTTDAGVFKP